jgi:FkbH-like protein
MNLEEYSAEEFLRKMRGLRRKYAAVDGLQPVRIAVLGGTTTNELVDFLEVFLLSAGFQPTFFQSEYGRFYEDAVVDSGELVAFAPNIVYIHTCHLNVRSLPAPGASETEFQRCVDAEFGRYEQIWKSIHDRLPAQIIQNNFELPPYSFLGNLDSVSSGGGSRFFLTLNARFAQAAAANPRMLLQDLHGLSARIGMNEWFDWDRYFSYKILNSVEGSLAMASSLASLVRAIYGKSRKVLVLDLDNTLWGGVIGDDGIDKIQIGRETPLAEAYTAFQEYCLSLWRRGVLLAVCSKNNEEIAKKGFDHPDSILKLEHFSSFKANWEPKHENILKIAQELNLGPDSFVFVDDNPAERAIVEAQISGIAVPNVGNEVSRFAGIIEQGRYFEPVSMTEEDVARAALYEANAVRASTESQFSNYGEYLDFLEMTAEIDDFKPIYIERIAQLTNKTNQFNLTTRRYSLAEMEAVLHSANHVGLYAKLTDRFGDNGLISVVLGRREDEVLHLDLWLMSCRVLKRDVEIAMLDVLAERARSLGVSTILGYYLPTAKNMMVADHYQKLGFELVSSSAEASTWKLDLATHKPLNQHIKILEYSHG